MTTSSRPVALITGSATGVGRACAIRFAKLGYDLVVNYSRSDTDAHETVRLVQSVGVRSLLIQADVADEAAVRSMIAEVEREYGRLDVLVNNAATTNFIPHVDLDSMTEDKWDRILGVNLKGPFFCVKHAASLLRSGEGGAVVNVSSVAGIAGLGSCIAYCASKAGLNTMTKSLARVMAPKVRVNAVCPGPIDSRWIREGNKDWDLAKMTADYPIPRPSQPDDIADAVVFLATGTSMITGQLMVIDGGRTM